LERIRLLDSRIPLMGVLSPVSPLSNNLNNLNNILWEDHLPNILSMLSGLCTRSVLH
jgi:hypothetical protein